MKPKIPTVVFIINLPEFIPAFFNSPCKILFGIVTKVDKLSRELLTPIFNGEGKLYKHLQLVEIIPHLKLG